MCKIHRSPLAVYTARRVADPHSRQPLPTHLDGVRHRLQSSVGSGSPAGALKHLRYCTLDQHSPKRGRGARQRQRGMAGRCKQSRKDGLERVSTAAELAHGKVSTHAPTQQAGRAQRCGRTPLQSVQGSIATYWRHWALTKSTVKGCRSRDRRHKILTRSRLGRELAHRTEAANGGAGACVARAAARCYEGASKPGGFPGA